jgi:hypothetical protein
MRSPSVENPSGVASVAYFFDVPDWGTSKTFQYGRSMRGGALYRYRTAGVFYFRSASSDCF